jgi:hypothetical protein
MVEKQEGKRPLRRPKRRRVVNSKMHLRAIDWINLAQDKVQWRDLLNTSMKLRLP